MQQTTLCNFFWVSVIIRITRTKLETLFDSLMRYEPENIRATDVFGEIIDRFLPVYK